MASSLIKFVVLLLIALELTAFVSCDVPVNCTYDDIEGEWLFYEGERSSTSSIDCKNFTGSLNAVFKVNLLFPDLAVDDFGNKGRWTIVYNQGFEVVLNYRKYFAFSMYEQLSNGTVRNYCDLTASGWSHDVLGNNWACYYGERMKGFNEPKEHVQRNLESGLIRLRNAESYIRLINLMQKSWTAKVYPELATMSYQDLVKRSGGFGSRVYSKPKPAPVDDSLLEDLSQLPAEFDWRDVDGVNYVSPVRQQGACGSCYAFSSLGMLESRLRIMTNNSVKVVFSPQDVVSCSEYAQGCEGGFPYVTAGKYAQDFGLVSEECYPYEGSVQIQCPPLLRCEGGFPYVTAGKYAQDFGLVSEECYPYEGSVQIQCPPLLRCEGGFPYVTAGKYAQDFGLVSEECYPYEGRDDQCSLKSCKRYYVAEYDYVGGFFGGCNEELMRLELVRSGPLTVAMEVYDDFMTYSGGVYQHTEVAAAFNPFHLVNHGVLIVGYGVCNRSGEKYWTVKNSWGESWGESGYFRIRRGTNECSIESMAVTAKPIP